MLTFNGIVFWRLAEETRNKFYSLAKTPETCTVENVFLPYREAFERYLKRDEQTLGLFQRMFPFLLPNESDFRTYKYTDVIGYTTQLNRELFHFLFLMVPADEGTQQSIKNHVTTFMNDLQRNGRSFFTDDEFLRHMGMVVTPTASRYICCKINLTFIDKVRRMNPTEFYVIMKKKIHKYMVDKHEQRESVKHALATVH
jgi:hypothetical protein